MDKNTIWTAAIGLAGALGTGAAGGYFVGDSVSSSEISALEKELEVERKTSGIDLELVISSLQNESALLGEKRTLTQKIERFTQIVNEHEAEAATQTETISQLRGIVEELQSEKASLELSLQQANSLFMKDLDSYKQFEVREEDTFWLVPGEYLIAYDLDISNKPIITITGEAKNKRIDRGESIKFSWNNKECQVALIDFENGYNTKNAATFAFSCKPNQKEN